MSDTTCAQLGNFGEMDCPFLMKIIRRVLFVPKFDSSGDPTKIALADLTKIAMQLRFDEEEPLDRIYPLPIVDNVADERAEATYFEWDSGDQSFIQENPRSFTGMIKRITPELIGRVNKWTGQPSGFYAFDADGNFIYNQAPDGSTDLYPIYMDEESIYAGLVKATYSDPNMGMLKFMVPKNVKDSDLRWLKASTFDFDGLSKTDVYGLKEVNINITAASATSLSFGATLDQGVVLSGLVTGEATIYNITTDAAVTVTGLTESGAVPGNYTAAYSAGVTAGDTLQVKINKTKLAFSTATEVVS